jgi:hypothetical protein
MQIEIATVAVEGPVGLAHVSGLLGLDRFQLGLSALGEWAIYAMGACQRLTADMLCSVWGTDEQPDTCKTYDEWTCWYTRVFDEFAHPEQVQLDAARLDAIGPLLGPAEVGLGVDRARWSEAVEMLAAMPPPVFEPPPPGGCGPGCVTVRVRRPPPEVAADFDHLRYIVGFRGIEVHVTGDEWVIAVHATGIAPESGPLYEVVPCGQVDGLRIGLDNVGEYVRAHSPAS